MECVINDDFMYFISIFPDGAVEKLTEILYVIHANIGDVYWEKMQGWFCMFPSTGA